MDSSATGGGNLGSLWSAEPAGFWIRLGAFLIDFLILCFCDLLLETIRAHWAAESLLSATYFTILVCSPWWATPGERLFGVYIARAEDGGRLGLRRSFARYLIASWPVILLAIIVTIYPTSGTTLSDRERAQEEAANTKLHRHETLNADEAAAISRRFTLRLSEQDRVRFDAAAAKLFAGQPLAPAEEKFYHDVQVSFWAGEAPTTLVLSILVIYYLAIALTIGQTPEKSGLHDALCKTRALRGRPGSPQGRA
jgi:uncharacterized RDD family membrane protein YckC